MRHSIFLLTLLLLSALPAMADNAIRRFLLADTLLTVPSDEFPLDTSGPSQLIEVRFSFPDYRGGVGEGSTWFKLSFTDSLTVSVRPGNIDFGSVSDDDYLRLTVSRGDSLLFTNFFPREFEPSRGLFNTMIVSRDSCGNMELWGGRGVPQLLARCKVPPALSAGLCIVPEKRLKVAALVVETHPDRAAALVTGWTVGSLSDYFDTTAETPEGIWQFFDRRMESDYARPGGRYRLALVKSMVVEGAFDILYLDGAVTNTPAWRQCMLKGRLIPTSFTNQYDLIWYDAMMEACGDDCSARMESDGSLLVIDFPNMRSRMRFSRVSSSVTTDM